MFKNLSRISTIIVLSSGFIATWSFIALLTKSSLSRDIQLTLDNILFHQKSVLINVKDLTELLIKDSKIRFKSKENDSIFPFEK